MIDPEPPTDQEGTAVPRTTTKAAVDRAAEQLVEQLGGDGLGYPGGTITDMTNAVEQLLAAGVLDGPTTAVVSDPLTAQQLAALAAATLAEARAAAASLLTEPAGRALVAVADGYRHLAVAVAGNLNLQPEPKDGN